MEKENIFKWKNYQPNIILPTVRWYLRYNLSLRDLVEMMEERGFSLAHTTIMRWVHQYGPELNERIRNMLGLKSLQTATKMIAGIEAMHMIKKGQTLQGEKSVQKQMYLINEIFGLTA